MNYKIVITKKEPNSNFAVEMAKFEEDRRYGYGLRGGDQIKPEPQITTDALICELTEEQFKKIKVEVLKNWE